MRLEKLELQGFKSFAKKTEIVFSNGVTAVIGPNGSGKSNILDAIRWVLGEQSAKALRGNRMEDVIFNGTEVKRPLSMCSVSLTFENKDRRLPLAFDEIEVTRRLYRSGECEYCLNGKNARLKDVLDLFRDTGIGKDGYSVISQGRVDEILSNRSRDRREALEEAAGVMRYRVRREEAERKLDQTAKNLERLGDIERELAARLGPLERESKRAKEAAAYQEELKVLEVNLFLRDTAHAEERIKAQQETLAALEQELAGNRAEDERLVKAAAEKEETLRALEESASLAREKEMNLLAASEEKQGGIRLEEERLRTAKTETERLTGVVYDREKDIRRVREALEASPETLREGLEKLEKTLEEKQAMLAEAERVSGEAEESLERMKNEIMRSMNRLSEAKSGRSRLEATLEALEKRGKELGGETTEAEKKLAALLEEEKTETETLAKMEAALQADKKAYDERSAALNGGRTRHNELLYGIRAAAGEEAGLSSRLHVLRELAEKREGYQNSVRFLMNDAKKNPRLASAITGVVAEKITVPGKLETAVGTALGGALQDIIAPTGEDGRTIIEYVREKQYGRVTVLPMDILRTPGDDPGTREYLSYPGVLGLASRLVSCAPEAEKAVEYLLGRTIVAEDMESALRLKKSARCTLQIVTLEGDVIQSGGAMSGGSKTGKQNFGLLSREREIAELEKTLREKQERRAALEKELSGLEKSMESDEAALNEQRSALEWKRTDAERQKDKLLIIARDREECLARIEALREEAETNGESRASVRASIESLEAERQALESADTVTRADVVAAQKAAVEKRALRDAAVNAVSDAKLAVTVAEKDALMRTRERERLQAELAAAEKEKAAAETEKASSLMKEAELAALLETLKAGAAESAAALENARAGKEAVEETLREGREEAAAIRAERDEALTMNRSILDRKTKAEMTLGKLQTEMEQLSDRIFQNYALTYENALKLRQELPAGATRARAAELRQFLREIGPVNPGSVEECAEVSARYAELKKQTDDLKKASEDLGRLIEKLTGTMEKVFSEGLKKVRTEFSAVFTELFGGGRAELRLQDPSDVLNSDIDIIAQPPGKKLQLLSLMSGGERALTAIALLFAMLRIKSPAFCVLDEIESSLDEENVNRFASFLKVYGQSTQFVVITHRKGSMEAAATLYGVAMEEKGVSSVVSAKWEEEN